MYFPSAVKNRCFFAKEEHVEIKSESSTHFAFLFGIVQVTLVNTINTLLFVDGDL